MKTTKVAIFECGKQLFSTKGFKHTNVSDITKLAGIGVGTFYNFYTSKEQLFLEAFLDENQRLKEEVIASVNLDDDPVDVAKKVVTRLFAGMNTNPILREWFNRDIYGKLKEQMDNEEAWTENADFSYNLFHSLILKWQTEGRIRGDVNPDVVLALFNSLSYVDLHKEDIGLEYFPDLIERFVEYIVNGLK